MQQLQKLWGSLPSSLVQQSSERWRLGYTRHRGWDWFHAWICPCNNHGVGVVLMVRVGRILSRGVSREVQEKGQVLQWGLQHWKGEQ